MKHICDARLIEMLTDRTKNTNIKVIGVDNGRTFSQRLENTKFDKSNSILNYLKRVDPELKSVSCGSENFEENKS